VAEGVTADLSHCNTPAQVAGFTGKDALAGCLSAADVVVIPAGVPRKPGMTRDDLFSVNAGIVRDLVAAVADHAPGALVHVISNPVNSTVPIAAEVLKQKGAYDPRRLFGVTTLDVVRANAFVAARNGLPVADVDVPVVGGHSAATILPLLSKARPKAAAAAFTDEEVEELTARIRDAGTEVVETKAGAGSATLSMAYAAARFLEASLRGLDGHDDVYECAYLQSQVVPELPFFACRVKLGRDGVEEVLASELKGLTDYEARELEALKPKLKASIDKGIAYVQQNQEAALN
jgi:malate dehydrogenase